MVFDGPEDYHARIDDPKTEDRREHSVLFIRGVGPVGYPGAAEVVNMRAPTYLLKKGVTALPCIGDGRQSRHLGLAVDPERLAGSRDRRRAGAAEDRRPRAHRPEEAHARTCWSATRSWRKRRAALDAAGGYPYPPSQTPWQEIQRGIVDELSERHGAQAGGEVPEDPRHLRRAARQPLNGAPMSDKVTVCAVGTAPPLVDKALNERFSVTRDAGAAVRGVAVCGGHTRIDAGFVERFPKLEIVSSFGVGYDHIDAADARRARRGRHAHARRAHRRGRRPGARPADRDRAPAAAGRPLPARGQVAEGRPTR